MSEHTSLLPGDPPLETLPGIEEVHQPLDEPHQRRDARPEEKKVQDAHAGLPHVELMDSQAAEEQGQQARRQAQTTTYKSLVHDPELHGTRLVVDRLRAAAGAVEAVHYGDTYVRLRIRLKHTVLVFLEVKGDGLRLVLHHGVLQTLVEGVSVDLHDAVRRLGMGHMYTHARHREDSAVLERRTVNHLDGHLVVVKVDKGRLVAGDAKGGERHQACGPKEMFKMFYHGK